MLTFLRPFLEIALWRKGPQDLPASPALAKLVLIAYVIAGFIHVRLFDLDARTAVIFVGVNVAMLAVWVYAVLAFFGRRQRFVQTFTAALGVGLLIVLLDILMRALDLALGAGDGLSGNWLFIRFLIIALAMGRIFMHALDRGLITGIALTVAIVYSTEAVAQLAIDRLA